MFLPNESKILFLYNGEYVEIDLTAEQPIRTCYATEAQFNAVGYSADGHHFVRNNLIYFSDSMSTRVGAFDRTTRTLVWTDALKNHAENIDVIAKIVATDTHVYFHDFKKNLFVFEMLNS